MRFSTLIPLLLAAGVVQAQNKGGNKGGQQKGGQQAAGQQAAGQQAAAQQAAAQQAAAAKQNGQNNGQQAAQAAAAAQQNGGNNGGNNAALALNPANVQTGSQSDGLADAEAGQAASDTDNANFINFCTGKTLTNGLQVKGGSCNGIVMGDLPASSAMVSAVFLNPKNNDKVQAGQDIKFTVQVANLNAGTFTNPDSTYYAAPQAVDNGKITGHTHITCQFIGQNDAPTTPLAAENFDFFKGINDAGDGKGGLSATLAGGFNQTGFYRVCSMTSSSNHAPVIMPVAQRGPQDDCVRFEVVNGAGGAQNNGQAANGQAANGQAANGQAANGQAANGQAAKGQQQQGQAAQGQQQQGQQQQGQAAQGQQQQGQQQKGQQGGGRRGRPKFQARNFVA